MEDIKNNNDDNIIKLGFGFPLILKKNFLNIKYSHKLNITNDIINKINKLFTAND